MNCYVNSTSRSAFAPTGRTSTRRSSRVHRRPPCRCPARRSIARRRRTDENPLTWWQGTPWLLWNKDYGGTFGIWAGAGEAEALGELFFDNLATMLSVTDLMLGFFLNVLVFNAASDVNQEYAQAISDRYTTLYYERCIPGVSVGLLFGNFYYGYMAGRLAHKEKRQDVTAKPYGINTTGLHHLRRDQPRSLDGPGFKRPAKAAAAATTLPASPVEPCS